VVLDKPVSAATPVLAAGSARGFAFSAATSASTRFAGLYVAVILAIVFSIWNPATFGTLDNCSHHRL
jgi:hypothetical protein